MNIFIIFFGCLIISVILILIFKGKKTKDKSFCTPDTKSCSQWADGKGVSDAFIPCNEGVNQNCQDIGGICPSGSVCAGDGCCVICTDSEDLPNSKTKTCGTDASGCQVQPENMISGSSIYTCSCATPNTDIKSCTNLTVSYLDSNGNSVPLNDSQSALQDICGVNYMTFPSGPSGSLASVSRKCDVDTSKNTTTTYYNYTCSDGYEEDLPSYSCTSGSGSNCIPNDPNAPPDCSISQRSTNYFCPIIDWETTNYCEGSPPGSTVCLTVGGYTGSNYYVGHKKCVDNGSGGGNLSVQCYPCCDEVKGWVYNEKTGKCENKCTWPYLSYKGHCLFYDPITTSDGGQCTTPFQTGVADGFPTNKNVFPITNTVANCSWNLGQCDNDVNDKISNLYGPAGPNYGDPFHISQMDWGSPYGRDYWWCTDTGFVEQDKWYCRPPPEAINPSSPYTTGIAPAWTYCNSNSPDYVTFTDSKGKSVSGCMWNSIGSRYMGELPTPNIQWQWYGGVTSQNQWTRDQYTQVGGYGGTIPPTSAPPNVSGNVIQSEGTGLYTPTRNSQQYGYLGGCSMQDFDNIIGSKQFEKTQKK